MIELINSYSTQHNNIATANFSNIEKQDGSQVIHFIPAFR